MCIYRIPSKSKQSGLCSLLYYVTKIIVNFRLIVVTDIAFKEIIIRKSLQNDIIIFREDREQFQGDPGDLVIYRLDLSSLKSVKECAKNLLMKESKIHLLINNAGVMMCPQETTEDGFELQLQTNYIGHFLLTLLLLPKMQSSASGCRILNVSSIIHLCM